MRLAAQVMYPTQTRQHSTQSITKRYKQARLNFRMNFKASHSLIKLSRSNTRYAMLSYTPPIPFPKEYKYSPTQNAKKKQTNKNNHPVLHGINRHGIMSLARTMLDQQTQHITKCLSQISKFENLPLPSFKNSAHAAPPSPL